MKWEFNYTRDGKQKQGYAKISAPNKKDNEWQVCVECDFTVQPHIIYGIDKNHAVEMGKVFLQSLYENFDPVNAENHEPLSWN